MAEETPQEAPKSKKKLFIIIGAAVVLLLAGLAGGFFFYTSSQKKAAEEEQKQNQVHVPEINPVNLGPMVDINDFVVNIISGEETHYVKVALTVELSNEPSAEEIKMRMPQMRDAIILILGSKDYRELQDIQGKKQLKAELLSRINSIIQSGKVVSIYFTEFVVQ